MTAIMADLAMGVAEQRQSRASNLVICLRWCGGGFKAKMVKSYKNARRYMLRPKNANPNAGKTETHAVGAKFNKSG